MNRVDRMYTSFSFTKEDLMSMMSEWLKNKGHTIPEGRIALFNVSDNGPTTSTSEWLRITIDSDVSKTKQEVQL